MRHIGVIRGLVLCCLCLSAGCAWWQNFTHPAPVAADPDALPEAGNDEEAGVGDLRNRLKRFRTALSSKHFSEADHELSRAEEGIKVSSEITRAHPDFDDLADAVRAGRPRLETAIEDDRIAKRNAAIDDLIRRGQVAMGHIGVVFEELAAHPPETEDLQNINDLVKTVSDLQREGEPYAQEPRYIAHAQKRDALASRLTVARVRVQRQIQTRQAVVPAITAGITAANDAKAVTNDDARIPLYEEVAKNFTLCAAALDAMTTQAGYDPSLVIDTRLGKLTAEQTRASCGETAKQAAGRVANLTWRRRVQGLSAQLQTDLQGMSATPDPEAKEAAHRKVIATLKTCQEDPNIDATAPGFDKQARFDSPFGKTTVPQLIARCGKEIAGHIAAATQLHWQAQAVAIARRLDLVQTQMVQAGHGENPTRQAAGWSAVVGGLKECSEQAQALMQLAGADPKQTFSTAWGAMTVPKVGERCAKERERAAASLAVALRHAEGQSFLAECHNDEITVVQREGTPTRIDTMSDGRVFVYVPEDGHGNIQRYAFDARGNRLDLGTRYKADVDDLLSQINALLPQVRRGGRDAQQVMETLTPVLEKCQSGTITEHSPSFDGTVIFETPFGKVDGPGLTKACREELQRERRETTRLAWQVRLQALADRATAAAQELQDTPQAVNPAEQVSRAAAAQGGFIECRERARALAAAEGADRAFKTATSWGKQNVDDIAKSCARALPEAQRALARAETRKKLADFINTCQGDEREVGERNGLPTRIEPKGAGRVFVYGKKRIAFDAAGHRTDEKQLQEK